MFEVFGSLVRGRRAEFQDSFVDFVRSKQDEQLKQIEIPTNRFWDKSFIANLFITKGRKATNIDTITFKDRISVITADGEFWSGTIDLSQPMSVLELRLTTRDLEELDALE